MNIKSNSIKWQIISNFIDWFTSDEDERREMKEGIDEYVEEDHIDDIMDSGYFIEKKKWWMAYRTIDEIFLDEYEVYESEKEAKEKYEEWIQDSFTFTTGYSMIIRSTDHE